MTILVVQGMLTLVSARSSELLVDKINTETQLANKEQKPSENSNSKEKDSGKIASEKNLEEKNFSGKQKKVPSVSYDSKEVEKAAELASAKTGVRKDFLMGMLGIETKFGQNTGQCTYGEVEKGAKNSFQNGRLSYRAWNTFNHRREIVKSLAEELGYDYKELKVSCNPANYAGTGGAMGLPQFMPDTWIEYQSRLARILKKDNPDPWNVEDGVMAMALKLSDVPGVTSHNYYAERNASKMYLSGSTSSAYDWYANQAQYWARNYRDVIG